MDSKEIIKKLYEVWQKDVDINNDFSTEERKCIFLSEAVVGIETYDIELSLEFGKMILEVLIQIKKRTTFEYIKDKECYKKYILTCNLIKDWLTWGTSIRGAWFGGRIDPHDSLMNIGYYEDYIEVTEDFMNWFVDWLST